MRQGFEVRTGPGGMGSEQDLQRSVSRSLLRRTLCFREHLGQFRSSLRATVWLMTHVKMGFIASSGSHLARSGRRGATGAWRCSAEGETAPEIFVEAVASRGGAEADHGLVEATRTREYHQ